MTTVLPPAPLPTNAGEFCAALRATGLLDCHQAEQHLTGQGDGLVLGHYRILNRLGSGGMGEVYKAEHVIMRRVVALKVMTPHLVGDRDAVARFHREIQVAARLLHPNIVTAYDAAEANGHHFLVMEFVAGVDLGRLVKESRPLPVWLACEYIRQAALGLQHAFEQGLVHCDIKPANLLVRLGGKTPLVKILDFGLARLARSPYHHAPPAPPPATGSGLAGTPDYMAPERARDSRAVDIRSDLYSLGCTFYHLLTGQVPYPGDTWSAKLVSHQFDSASPVTKLRPDVPWEVETIVQRLMAKNPADRYPTPGDLAGALQDWLSTYKHPVASPEPTASPAAMNTPVAAGGLTLPNSCCSAQEGNLALPFGSTSDTSASANENPMTACRRAKITQGIRRLASWYLSIGAAVALGLFIAWLVRPPAEKDGALAEYLIPERETARRETSPSATSCARAEDKGPFRLVSKPGKTFNSLADAFTAAEDGDTLVIHGHGPFHTWPLVLRGKALTLKAAPGDRPRIELAPAAADPVWQPLLTTDRALTVEGVELCQDGQGKLQAESETTHLIYSEQAPLRLVKCSLRAPRGRALLVCRKTRQVELHDCVLVADASAVCLEMGNVSAPEVILKGCTLTIKDAHGAALLLWAAQDRQPARVRLHLQGNNVQTGRVIALAGLVGGADVTVQGNTFTFQQALLSCAGFPSPGGCRQAVRWHGHDNRYQASADWLWVNGSGAGLRGLKAWQEFWQAKETGSFEAAPSFPVETALREPAR